jgi:hypothetical protein
MKVAGFRQIGAAGNAANDRLQTQPVNGMAGKIGESLANRHRR